MQKARKQHFIHKKDQIQKPRIKSSKQENNITCLGWVRTLDSIFFISVTC